MYDYKHTVVVIDFRVNIGHLPPYTFVLFNIVMESPDNKVLTDKWDSDRPPDLSIYH